MTKKAKELEIKLNFKNFKKLEDNSFEMTGDYLYLVRGKNDSGKTSLIQALIMMMTANKKLIPNPITNGKDMSYIEGNIPGPEGNYRIRIDIMPNGTSFLLFKPNGEKIKKVTDIREIFDYNSVTVEEFIRKSYTPAGRREQMAILANLLPETYRNRFNELRESVSNTGNLFVARKEANADLAYQEKLLLSNSISDTDLEFYKENSDVSKMIELIENNITDLEKIPSKETNIRLINDSYAVSINNLENDIRVNKNSHENDLKEKNELEIEMIKIQEKLKVIEGRMLNRIPHIKTLESNLTTLINNKAKELADLPETEEQELEMTQLKEEKLLLNGTLVQIGVIKSKIEEKEKSENNIKIYTTKAEIKEKALTDAKTELEQIIKQINVPGYAISVIDNVIHIDGFILDENQISDSKMTVAITAILAAANTKSKILCVGKLAELDDSNKAKLVEIAKANNLVIIGDEVTNEYDDIYVKGFQEETVIPKIDYDKIHNTIPENNTNQSNL